MDGPNPQSHRATDQHPEGEAQGGSCSTGGVDIIVRSLFADGSAKHNVDITSKSQLLDFLNGFSLRAGPINHYLLLIEDISSEVIREFINHLDIQIDAFKHHTNGRLNGDAMRQEENVLHAQKLSSTLLGRASARKDNYSLTWWKLLTHSLAGYTYEREALTESDADATKIVVPHFSVHISDTRRKVGSSKSQATQVKSGFSEFVRQWRKTRDESATIFYAGRKKNLVEQREETVCKLHCNTYRPHQVISEVKQDRWGSAGEERLTYVKASMLGSIFYIFLFDKERTLREYTQSFEIDYTGAQSYGVLETVLQDKIRKPTTRLISEQRGALIPTFMTSSEAEATPVLAGSRERRRSRVYSTGVNMEALNVIENPPFDDSTRHRFLKGITRQRLLDSLGTQSGDDLPILRIQLAFTKMMTEDWDLVLSQMGQTLDDIDRKMSDNSELRRNVLAWRRLLGSWRMTIIEYKAKLSETVQFLRTQTRQPVKIAGRALPTEDSSHSHSQDGDQLDAIARQVESELEDMLSSYQILTDGIKEIEKRVERSFHALMSSMSIIESQKAIVQGSAVARLTELAFVFIPLNFACTFFSMQITNFQGKSQPSIGAFFALAIPLMIFLYSLRAFIRSRLLYNITHRVESKIRETSKIPGTSEIPTRVIVSFGWQQLGPFWRALLLVVPLALTVLILIVKLSEWRAFRIAGSVITVLGTLTIILFLAIESYVPALQAFAVVAWLISMLGIGLGRIEPLNSAVMGTLCTIVTTVFFIALAFIPQKITENPMQRAGEILLPLWLIELPIAIICHYYKISNPQWVVWVLLIGLFSVFIIFGIVVFAIDVEIYRSLAQGVGLAAFAIGFPMAMVWSYTPEHGSQLPLYGAIIVTFASVAFFFVMIRHFRYSFDADSMFRKVSYAHAVFFVVLCGMVAIPVTLVWDTLPSSNIPVPRWAQISVTCGSTVLFATFITFIRAFSENLGFLALSLYWAATAAWLPALLWAGNIGAFKGLTDNQTKTVHVTWTSVLFWTIFWVVVALKFHKRDGRSRIQHYGYE